MKKWIAILIVIGAVSASAQNVFVSNDAAHPIPITSVAGGTATGASVPANATYEGINVGGTLRGLTGTNTTGTVYAANVVQAAVFPSGATAKTGASGNVANASAAATLAAVGAKTNYVTGFQITAAGSTGALVVNATLTGLITGTQTYTFVFPAGVTAAATPLIVTFPYPVPASAVNTAITITLPAGGAGNTNAATSIQGFDL